MSSETSEIIKLINAKCEDACKEIYSGLKCYAKIVQPNGCIDGDTIKVVFYPFGDKLVEIKIRLLGINAPESRTHDLNEKERGIAAKKYLESIISTNEHGIVYIECGEFDSFGRVLAKVYQVRTGNTISKKSINEKMLKAGHAVIFMESN